MKKIVFLFLIVVLTNPILAINDDLYQEVKQEVLDEYMELKEFREELKLNSDAAMEMIDILARDRYNYYNNEILTFKRKNIYKIMDNKAIQEVLDEYMILKEFRKDLRCNSKSAFKMIEIIARNRYYRYDYIVSSSKKELKAGKNKVRMFKQSKDYYCGPSSLLTSLYYSNDQDKVEGNNIYKKQETLAAEMGTSSGSGSGTMVFKMRDTLNKYTDSKWTYMTKPSYEDLHYFILQSLSQGHAPIIHGLMEKLPYYDSKKSGGHYITIIYYNELTPTADLGIKVMDNNGEQDGKYYGYQFISFDTLMEILNTVDSNGNNRYIIGATRR